MTELTTPDPGAPAPDPPRPSRRRRLTRWLGDRPRVELYAWLGLIAIAFALRIIDVGSRPFHHDESQDAYFSWVFFERGEYEYQPILHGPLRFYLTSLVYLLFGDSDVTARLAPVLMGTLTVGLAYLMRPHIGRLAAFAAGVMLAVGPSYLYFSRFAREDIYIAAITLGLFVAMFRFLDRPRTSTLCVVTGLVALSFATKETTFITGFVIFTYLVLAVAIQSLRAANWRDGEIVRAARTVGWAGWGYALAVFWIVFAVLFTVFFTNPDGLRAGVVDGLDYWLSQQPVARGGERWYFYTAVLFGVEWPVLLLGGVGIAWTIRHPTTQRLFLVWAFALSLAIYSWASERFAWLVLHPLLPLILLAGIGVQALWSARSKQLRIVAAVVIAVALAYTGYASFLANARHGADPREWLVSTQSSVETKEVVGRVRALDRRLRARTGEGVTITIDSGQGATYPYAWYFRDLEVGYIDMTTPDYAPATDVLIMTEAARTMLLPRLSDYEGRRFPFRVWWVRDWSRKFDAGAWWTWFTERKPWNPTGGMFEWEYTRRDADPG